MTARHVVNATFLLALVAMLGLVCGHFSPPMRFQLVGFTTATYDGNLGGPFGFTQSCQAEFPGSRWCTHDEIEQTTTIPPDLVGEAWVGGASEVIACGISPTECGCQGWTTAAGNGFVVDAGGRTASMRACQENLSLACCALRP